MDIIEQEIINMQRKKDEDNGGDYDEIQIKLISDRNLEGKEDLIRDSAAYKKDSSTTK
jgi:hypothetical protein